MPEEFVESFITTFSFIIAGILYLIQTVLLGYYLFELKAKNVGAVTDSKRTTATVLSNIVFLIGGFGLGVLILAFYNLFNKISKKLAFDFLFYITLITSAIVCGVSWFFIPNTIDTTTDTTKKNDENKLDFGKNLIVALAGFLLGVGVFNVFMDILSDINSVVIVSSIELIIIFSVFLVQSICAFVAFHLLGGTTSDITILGKDWVFNVAFILFIVIGVLGIIGGAVLLFATE